MPSKLPDTSVFDSPFRSTLDGNEPTQKARKKAKKPELAVIGQPASEPSKDETFKATAYLSEPQWRAIHEEIHRKRMAGQRGNAANISRVIGAAIDHWMASQQGGN